MFAVTTHVDELGGIYCGKTDPMFAERFAERHEAEEFVGLKVIPGIRGRGCFVIWDLDEPNPYFWTAAELAQRDARMAAAPPELSVDELRRRKSVIRSEPVR